MQHKRISIVIPCFNEEENVDETYRQLKLVTTDLQYSFEFIFVDNGSLDATRKKIQRLSEKDKEVIGVVLSRNFGPESSALAGFAYASGEAIITCVCDLQDPIEYVPTYLKRWEEGCDIVFGQYTKTPDTPWMAVIRRWYYKMFKAVASIDIPLNSSGMCLFSRKALNGLLEMKERFRSSVGIRAWIGFKTDYITYERRERRAGKSSYNLIRYLQTAERSFFGFSYLPLDMIVYLGFGLFGLSVLFLILYMSMIGIGLVEWEISVGIFLAVIVFGSIQLLALSAIGKYIQVIVEETKQRPLYIVDTIYTQKSITKSLSSR